MFASREAVSSTAASWSSAPRSISENGRRDRGLGQVRRTFAGSARSMRACGDAAISRTTVRSGCAHLADGLHHGRFEASRTVVSPAGQGLERRRAGSSRSGVAFRAGLRARQESADAARPHGDHVEGEADQRLPGLRVDHETPRRRRPVPSRPTPTGASMTTHPTFDPKSGIVPCIVPHPSMRSVTAIGSSTG